jgi:hypothetical protein
MHNAAVFGGKIEVEGQSNSSDPVHQSNPVITDSHTLDTTVHIVHCMGVLAAVGLLSKS